MAPGGGGGLLRHGKKKLQLCFSHGGTSTIGGTRTVACWYAKKFRVFNNQNLKLLIALLNCFKCF